MFLFDEINNKKILKSTLLDDKPVKHLFTTRETVTTPKDLAELADLAQNNLKIIANYLDVDKNNIIIPVQTHSANIKTAKKGQSYPDTDALVVEDADIAILLNFADCTPVILYDEIQNIGAIVHAGWRGTAASIAAKTVEFMNNRYRSNPDDITAVIGPAISMKNYQVDENVFKQLRITLQGEYSDYFSFDDIQNKYNVDLKTINFHQLRELGIKRIDKCGYCTYDAVDVFFSYRREHGKTARHSAVLKLNN